MIKNFNNYKNEEVKNTLIIESVSYDDIEKLTSEVNVFIEEKGFEIMDSFGFLTKLENLLYEGINKE